MLKGAAHGLHQRVEIEGFWQVIVGAALGCGDCRHDGVLRAHDDDGQIGPQFFDARDHVEGVFIGQHHVGQNGIALPFGNPAPQGRCRGG